MLCLSVSLSLFMSVSLFSCLSLSLSTCSHLHLFLCSSLFTLTFSLLFHNSFSLSSGSLLSLSVRKSLTCPETQGARALVRSLNGELLASRRKNLYRCSVVCGCGCGCGCCCICCCCCCGALYPSKRFAVTPAVCPRLFEFLTTLTFGALRENHIVSPSRTSQKEQKNNNETSSSTCAQQCIMKCQDRRSCKNGTLREKKTDPTSITVPQENMTSVIVDKSPRKEFFSITVLINSKRKSRIKLRILRFILSKHLQPDFL